MTETTFGQRLKKAMERSGLTSEALAEKTNISCRSIEDYRVDKHEPVASKLVDLSNALDVSVNYLLGTREPFKSEYLVEREMRLELLSKVAEYERQLGAAGDHIKEKEGVH